MRTASTEGPPHTMNLATTSSQVLRVLLHVRVLLWLQVLLRLFRNVDYLIRVDHLTNPHRDIDLLVFIGRLLELFQKLP